MPQEPYWEVMSYMGAKAERVESAGLLVTNVGAAASGIVSSILTAFAGATLDGLKPRVIEYLSRNIGLATSLKATDVAHIGEQIENTLNQDYSNIVDLTKGGIGQGVGSIHASFYESLNGVNALMSSYIGLVQRIGIDPYMSRYVNSTIRPNILDTESAWYAKKLGLIDDTMYKTFASYEGWDDSYLSVLDGTWTRPAPFGALYDMTRRGAMSVDDFKQHLRRFRVSEQAILSLTELLKQIPEPYRISEFAAKGLLDDAMLESAFTWFGMDKGWADMWKAGQQRFPQFGIMLELLWRGAIDVDTIKVWMQRDAVMPEVTDKMLALAEVIPTPSDLTYMAAREGFGDHTYAAQYPALESWITKMGWSKQMASSWWYAHWIRTALPEAYRNLWRGNWDKDKFTDWMTIVDIHPNDREDIYNVAFGPPSIREMGYGYDVGAYTVDDIVKYRRWAGLSLEDATKSGQAMVRYRTEAQRNNVRGDYLKMYVNGNLTKDDFTAALEALATVPEAIPLWIEHGDMEIELKSTETSILEPKNITRTDAQWLFENGLRDEAFLRDTLKNLGYLDASIESYVDISKKKIADKAAKPVAGAPKLLTLANIQNLIKLNVIDAVEAVAKVKGLNYTEDDARLIVQIMLNNLYPEPTPKSLTDSQMAALYDYDLVSETEILAHLTAEGYSDIDARLLTQYIVINKNLPDLKSMYSLGWIDQNALFEGVKALGIPMEYVEPSLQPTLKKLIETIGLPDEKAKRVMLTIVKATQPTRVAAEKALTKAEILKGVKVGVISAVEGVQMLMSLGYTENEAYYILAINKLVTAGDPEGYWDMRRVTEAYKKARGLPAIEVPQELVSLEAEQRTMLGNLNKLKADKASEIAIGEAAVQLAGVESRMHTIISKLKLA